MQRDLDDTQNVVVKIIQNLNRFAKGSHIILELLGTYMLVLLLVCAELGVPFVVVIKEKSMTLDLTTQPFYIVVLWLVFVLFVWDIGNGIISSIRKKMRGG